MDQTTTDLKVGERLATHCFRRPTENGLWIPLTCLTKKSAKDKSFFAGFEDESIPEAGVLEAEGKSLYKFTRRLILTIDGPGPWLADDGTIWWARKDFPSRDPNRVSVGNIFSE